MITVEYLLAGQAPGTKGTVFQIAEGRDPFEVLVSLEKRIGWKPSAETPKFDAIMREREQYPIDLRSIEERMATPLDATPKRTVTERTTDLVTKIESPPPAAPNPEGASFATTSGPTSGSGLATVARPGGVRDTSMAAYSDLKGAGKLGQQQEKIVALWSGRERDLFTRQEIARDAGLSINATCGRVAELLDGPLARLVEVPEKKVCSVTKNKVNALGLASEHPRGG